jgi:hypothetical protein
MRKREKGKKKHFVFHANRFAKIKLIEKVRIKNPTKAQKTQRDCNKIFVSFATSWETKKTLLRKINFRKANHQQPVLKYWLVRFLQPVPYSYRYC